MDKDQSALQEMGTEVAFKILNANVNDDGLLTSKPCDYWYANCGINDCAAIYVCCNTICNCAVYG